MDGLNYQNSCVQIHCEEMVKMQSCKKTNLLLHLTKLTKKVSKFGLIKYHSYQQILLKESFVTHIEVFKKIKKLAMSNVKAKYL